MNEAFVDGALEEGNTAVVETDNLMIIKMGGCIVNKNGLVPGNGWFGPKKPEPMDVTQNRLTLWLIEQVLPILEKQKLELQEKIANGQPEEA